VPSDTSETRWRFLEPATDDFARDGYVGANINRISSSAGFAQGTVHNDFHSKRALMCALIGEQGQPFLDPGQVADFALRALRG